MPVYRCHKTVHALKIKTVIADSDGVIIVPEDKGYGAFAVAGDYAAKHNPKAGGYYVVYDDGYASYSPAKAFEEGYTLCR